VYCCLTNSLNSQVGESVLPDLASLVRWIFSGLLTIYFIYSTSAMKG